MAQPKNLFQNDARPGGAQLSLMSLRADWSKESEVRSPCVNVCRMNTVSGYCEGCYRTLEEIACWSAYDATQKRAVLARLPGRRIEP